MEPVAAAIETVRREPPERGEPVAILGTGKVGLIVAQVYEVYGAEPYLLGNNQWKLGLARQIGMKNVLNVGDPDWKEVLLNATEGVGPRIIVDATGTPEALRTAMDLVRSGGTIVMRSAHRDNLPVSAFEMVTKEISLVGTRTGGYKQAIDLLAKGRIEVKRLVSKQFPLDEGERAFEYAAGPDSIKVIINV